MSSNPNQRFFKHKSPSTRRRLERRRQEREINGTQSEQADTRVIKVPNRIVEAERILELKWDLIKREQAVANREFELMKREVELYEKSCVQKNEEKSESKIITNFWYMPEKFDLVQRVKSWRQDERYQGYAVVEQDIQEGTSTEQSAPRRIIVQPPVNSVYGEDMVSSHTPKKIKLAEYRARSENKPSILRNEDMTEAHRKAVAQKGWDFFRTRLEFDYKDGSSSPSDDGIEMSYDPTDI